MNVKLILKVVSWRLRDGWICLFQGHKSKTITWSSNRDMKTTFNTFILIAGSTEAAILQPLFVQSSKGLRSRVRFQKQSRAKVVRLGKKRECKEFEVNQVQKEIVMAVETMKPVCSLYWLFYLVMWSSWNRGVADHPLVRAHPQAHKPASTAARQLDRGMRFGVFRTRKKERVYDYLTSEPNWRKVLTFRFRCDQ